MYEVKNFITDMIQTKHPRNGGIHFCMDEVLGGKRFWVDVLNADFNGDLENGDPLLEQYTLVPISKIQDRLDIMLDETNAKLMQKAIDEGEF